MNIGFKHRLDGEIEASAHGKPTFFFCYYGDFQSMAELRCTPREYGLLPILRAVNDAFPMRATLLGISQIVLMQTEAFLAKNRGASHGMEKQEVFEKYDHRH